MANLSAILKDKMFYSQAVFLFLFPRHRIRYPPSSRKVLGEHLETTRNKHTGVGTGESLLSSSGFNKLKEHMTIYQYNAHYT